MVDLDKRDESGYCAAHYCSIAGNLTMLAKLHEAGASMKRKRKMSSGPDASASTVFSIAKQKGFTEIADFVKSVNHNRKSSSNSLDVPGR